MPDHPPPTGIPPLNIHDRLLRGPRKLPPVTTRQRFGEAPIDGPVYDRDLRTLRCKDPSIVSTLAQFNRVTLYRDEDQREAQGFEGRMIIYERDAYPVYGFCILNAQSAIVHIQNFYPEDDLSVQGNRLQIKSYPDFTNRRLTLALSSSIGVHKVSDIYRIPNLDSLSESSKGAPRTVELLAFGEDMIEVVTRLYSYLRINQPYPKESISGSSRPLIRHPVLYPVSTSIAVPSSPSTSYSPSPSPCFSPLVHSICESPPTSAAPSPPSSPSTTSSFHSPRPSQANKDYRLRALLNSLLLKPGSTPSSTYVPTSGMPLLGSTNVQAYPTQPLTRDSTVPVRRPKENPNQRLPSSRLVQVTDASETAVFNEAVFSRNDLPPCSELRGVVKKIGESSFAAGGYSDVFEGQLENHSEDANTSVAIKVLRLSGSNDSDPAAVEKLNTQLDRESKVWNSLHHPNVLPFLGISREFGPFPALISPYCPSRDVVTYLKRHPYVHRRPIALGFTDGLRYLHSRRVIHADLKGSNVLIGSKGEALICDFGVSKIIDCQGFTTNLVGTPPFMAPELFPDFDVVFDEDAVDNDPRICPKATKETDVYAFGLVLLQILTGKDPKIHYYLRTPKVQLPPKRQYYGPMNDQLWGLVETCCHLDPEKRPTMEEVMQKIPSIDIDLKC